MTDSEYRSFFPAHARQAASVLYDAGYEAYFVGGCVRDFFMGHAPKDFDLTTNASSDDLLRCFAEAGMSAYLKGGACGTVGVKGPGEEIEITPYRTETGYDDHRHPSQVRFVTSLSEDLSRRDFTVNSLAVGYDAGTLRVVDEFGGVEDIRRKTLRCVGRAADRFEEDALRMLRAVRFAAVLGFTVAPEVRSAIAEKTALLDYISGERKSAELHKLLESAAPERILTEFSGFLSYILGPIEPQGVDLVTGGFCGRFFYMTRRFSDGAFDKAVQPLKLSGEELSRLYGYRRVYHGCHGRDEVAAGDLPSLCAEFGYFLKDYLSLSGSRCADGLFSDPAIPKTVSELAVNGEDMKQAGLAGKQIGETLKGLLLSCLRGEIKNTREDLTEEMNRRLSQGGVQ